MIDSLTYRRLGRAVVLAVLAYAQLIPTAVYGSGTPAGTVISCQATVSFFYGGDPSQRRSSSNIVSVTVAQVAAVGLAPATGTDFGRLNSFVDYPFSLVNSGNGSDRFSFTSTTTRSLTGQVFLDANGDQGLNTQEIAAGPVLNTADMREDQVLNLVLRISVPDSVAMTGQTDVFTLTASSSHDPSKHAVLSRSTTIMGGIVVLQKSVNRTVPRAGERVMYTIAYSNPGNATATGITLTDQLDPRMHYVTGSASPDPDSASSQMLHWSKMSVQGKGLGYITFLVDILNNVAAGTEIHNVVTGVYQDGQTVRSLASVEENFMTVQSSGYVTVDVGRDTSAVGEPGDTLQYVFVIKNNGALPEEFDLSYTSTQGLAWTFYTDPAGADHIDPGASPITETGTLTGGSSCSIIARTVLPVVVNDQVQDFTTFRVQSRTNQSNIKTVNGTSTVQIPKVSLMKTVNATDPRSGSEITYSISFVNSGHGAAYDFAVVDSIPGNTAYVSQSTTVNGISKTDEKDGDEVMINGGILTVNVGTVLPNGRGTIAFRVRIL